MAYLLVMANYRRLRPLKGTPLNTTTGSKQLIELHVEVNPEGEVTPVIPVSWTITEELVQEIADRGFTNPHVLLIVAAKRVEKYGGHSTVSYDPTRVYAIDLKSTPKAYVQFNRPGENVIVAVVVDLASKQMLRVADDWVKGRETPSIWLDDSEKEIEHLSFFYTFAHFIQKVVVPKELFAPPPPKFLRSLVTQFFPAYAVDQCHFRKRLIMSIIMSIPVQLYGVFARFGSLLYGLFMMKRGMSMRNFFAFNPHDFARGFDKSFWFYTKDGSSRDSWWPLLSPPFLVLFGVILTLFGMFCYATTMVALRIIYGPDFQERPLPFEELVATGVVVNGVIAVVVLGLLTAFTWKGRRLTRRLYEKISNVFNRLKQTDEKELERAKVEAENALISQLRLRAQQSTAITTANDVKNDSIKLKFYDLKAKACKPFAT